MNEKIFIAILTVLSLFAVNANAGPMAYSVNSDGNPGDGLFLIDLATGEDKLRGPLEGIGLRTDTEGLAFSPGPNSQLWGLDDDSGTLFPINPANGAVIYNDEIWPPPVLGSSSLNDFGMTFACDSSLYFTSVATQSLYRRDTAGKVTIIGSTGSLKVNISAIAAIGNPTRLYGLGNGQDKNGNPDAPNLYSIDTTTGVAKLIGPLGTPGQYKYNEAGMDFDAAGVLWAITDRSQIDNLKSQILKIDLDTGAATWVSTTVNQVGYESLAIGPPVDCSASIVGADDLPPIPTLSFAGRMFAVLVLMLAGMLFLRRRYFKSTL